MLAVKLVITQIEPIKSLLLKDVYIFKMHDFALELPSAVRFYTINMKN